MGDIPPPASGSGASRVQSTTLREVGSPEATPRVNGGAVMQLVNPSVGTASMSPMAEPRLISCRRVKTLSAVVFSRILTSSPMCGRSPLLAGGSKPYIGVASDGDTGRAMDEITLRKP
jgi:hypothetical protein